MNIIFKTSFENACDFLDKLQIYLQLVVDGNQDEMKWVILSLHGVLYQFSLNILEGTDGAHLAKSNKFSNVSDAFNVMLNSNAQTEVREAVKYLKAKDFVTAVEAVITLKDKEKESLKTFNQIRNTIIHDYTGFCIEIKQTSLVNVISILNRIIKKYPIDYESANYMKKNLVESMNNIDNLRKRIKKMF